MSYPQNGNRLVTIVYVTSLHLVYLEEAADGVYCRMSTELLKSQDQTGLETDIFLVSMVSWSQTFGPGLNLGVENLVSVSVLVSKV